MASLTDYAKNLLARALVGRQPAPARRGLGGAGTGGTDAAGLSGEPAAPSGYARQPVTFTGSGAQRNTAPLRFAFTTSVGTITHVGLYDAVGPAAMRWPGARSARRPR